MYRFYLSFPDSGKYRIFNNWVQYLSWKRYNKRNAKGFDSVKDAVTWLNSKGVKVSENDFPLYLKMTEPHVFDPSIVVHSSSIVGENEVVIYTDGSCLSNPNGPGGFSSILLLPDGREVMISGYEFCTTNNRMEIMGAIVALDWLTKDAFCQGKKVTIKTDSQYLNNIFSKNWIERWKSNGWQTVQGKDVLNKDLLEILDWLVSITNAKFVWEPGHGKSYFNQKADMIAGKQARWAFHRGGYKEGTV